LLTVDGNLDIRQFWPATKGTNSSDGDTVHLKVNPDASFRFASSDPVTLFTAGGKTVTGW
jgi:hypothetical protein